MFRFAALAFTALTLCAFYADGAGRVIAEDWGLNRCYARDEQSVMGVHCHVDPAQFSFFIQKEKNKFRFAVISLHRNQ